MSIKDLTDERADLGMPIDDVLEGLSPELRTQLEHALIAKHPIRSGMYLWSRDDIISHCADDGFKVTDWSIRTWRKRHGGNR